MIKKKIIDKVMTFNSVSDITIDDIWIDIPFPPSADEAKLIEVKKKRTINDSIQLSNIFPLEQWVDAYKRSKLRGHIFCEKKYQKEVYEASRIVLKELFGYTTKTFTKDFIKVK